ncbi:MAG: hypothetical protein D6B26_02780, partial [Spirochaetaceae bacterium]
LGLIELIDTRRAIRNQEIIQPQRYLPGLRQDFANIARIIQQGHYFTIYTQKELNSSNIPVNSIILPGDVEKYCYRGVCHKGLIT